MKKFKPKFLTILCLSFWQASCVNSTYNSEKSQNKITEFEPVVFSQEDIATTNAFSRDSIGDRFNVIIGLFNFSDQDDYVDSYLDSFYVNLNRIPIEKAQGSYPSNLKVYVDTTHLCVYQDRVLMREKKLFRPTYIMNLDSTLQFLHNKNQNIIAVQEALDSNGNWSLIELTNLDFCGNGYGYIPIEPQEYVLTLAPVYDGNYKTKIRYKIISKDTVLYSNEYTGYINYNQFYLRWKKGRPIEIKGRAEDINSDVAQKFFKNGFLGSAIKIKTYEP